MFRGLLDIRRELKTLNHAKQIADFDAACRHFG